MFRVGLTGGIASGKSAVAHELAALGAVVVDADELVRELQRPGTSAMADIVDRFGPGVLTPDGTLDRAILGGIIFSDAAARADLNAILHPRVRLRASEIEAQVTDPDAVVVHVIPLLVETGQQHDFDAVVVVDVDESTQLARLQVRDQLDATEARSRVAAQATRAERLAVADHVIRNDSTLTVLADRVAAVWRELQPAGTA